MPKNIKVPLNVRVDADLRDHLRDLARDENRTLSNLVDTALRLYLRDASSQKIKKSIVDTRGWIANNAIPGETPEQARDRFLEENKL